MRSIACNASSLVVEWPGGTRMPAMNILAAGGWYPARGRLSRNPGAVPVPLTFHPASR